MRKHYPVCLSVGLFAFSKSLKLHRCRSELDSKELFNMARKLHGRKDPERDTKAKENIDWIKEMMEKSHLASIF